jgi:uncharacterized protein YtpQ (UPF0354 family)
MAFGTRLVALAFALSFVSTAGAATSPAADTMDISASNLIVVLRESAGENKQDEALQPYGRVTAQMPDGKRVDLATSWYRYLGDMHIRLVFDGGQSLQSASPMDLERLKLTPEDALDVAVHNLRRMYGMPQAVPWTGGLMQVQGGSPDLASSYFLDREFWMGQLREHPEGIVVAVPQRGGLVFTSAADEESIGELRFSAAALYAGGGGARVSSALYLFKNGRWSVFQPAQQIQ